jgi:serine/threonine protein kinase
MIEARPRGKPAPHDRVVAHNTVLRAGSWFKPEIRLSETAESAVVVKDYGRWPLLLRPIALFLCRHEARTYRELTGIEGIPRLMGTGPDFIALEPIGGGKISEFDPAAGAADLIRRLEQIVDQVHRAGICHLDLRKRDNVLVTADGRPVILDFATSLRVGGKGPLSRLLRPVAMAVDRYGVLKWKRALAPQALTGEEGRFLRRLDALRLRGIFRRPPR